MDVKEIPIKLWMEEYHLYNYVARLGNYNLLADLLVSPPRGAPGIKLTSNFFEEHLQGDNAWESGQECPRSQVEVIDKRLRA